MQPIVGDRNCACEITDTWGRQRFSCLVISAAFFSTILSLKVIQGNLWALLLLLLSSCFKSWNPLLSSVRCLQLGDLAAHLPFLEVRLLQNKAAKQLGAALVGRLFNTLKHFVYQICHFYCIFIESHFSFFCVPFWCLCLHCSHGFCTVLLFFFFPAYFFVLQWILFLLFSVLYRSSSLCYPEAFQL